MPDEPNPKMPDPPKAEEMETTGALVKNSDAISQLMDYHSIHRNPEYGTGIPATGPTCPWCGRPEVENMPPGTKVRCFCDRLYIIAERK